MLVLVEPPTVSQFPPAVVEGAALNVTADPLLVVTMTLCAEGAVSPAVALKLRPAELRLRVGTLGGIGVVTLTVTGTESGLFDAPEEVNTTLAL